MATSTTFVYTMTSTGKIGAWSRYVFPFVIDAFAQLGNDLYIRHGDTISVVSEDAVDDNGTAFPGTVWWPWLDFGRPGVTKMLEGFDYVGSGQGPSISIGYDQRDVTAFTTPYAISSDTLPGGIIPLPVSAPTFSMKIEFVGAETWTVQQAQLSVIDLGNGP